MKQLYGLWAIVLAALLLVPVAAQAQTTAPSDAIGSLVITNEQMANDVEVFITAHAGINVFYILPRGWDVGEQGVDKETGELMENVNRYVLVSRSPVVDENDVPDLVFELNIFDYGLLDGMPEGLSDEERMRYEADAFTSFLDVQLSDALNSGLHCLSNPGDIVPKPYGTGTRPKTLFVPIYYETQGGAEIYTFTSAYAGKVWMLKFLVKADQVANYGGLIALILNNSFALTPEEFDEYNQDMAAAAAEAAAAENE